MPNYIALNVQEPLFCFYAFYNSNVFISFRTTPPKCAIDTIWIMRESNHCNTGGWLCSLHDAWGLVTPPSSLFPSQEPPLEDERRSVKQVTLVWIIHRFLIQPKNSPAITTNAGGGNRRMCLMHRTAWAKRPNSLSRRRRMCLKWDNGGIEAAYKCLSTSIHINAYIHIHIRV